MTQNRLCTTVSATSDSEYTPTHRAFDPSEFCASDCEETLKEEHIAVQGHIYENNSRSEGTHLSQINVQLEKAELQIAVMAKKLQISTENILNPGDAAGRAKSDEARDYLSISLLREMRKTILHIFREGISFVLFRDIFLHGQRCTEELI